MQIFGPVLGKQVTPSNLCPSGHLQESPPEEEELEEDTSPLELEEEEEELEEVTQIGSTRGSPHSSLIPSVMMVSHLNDLPSGQEGVAPLQQNLISPLQYPTTVGTLQIGAPLEEEDEEEEDEEELLEEEEEVQAPAV